MNIRDATPADAPAIAAIYNLHVRSTIVTFELDEVGDVAMAQRINDVQSRGLPWLVHVEAEQVMGYAHAGPWKTHAGR